MNLAHAAGQAYLRLNGWRVQGAPPDVDKAVLIAAPHTSNWDLPYMLATSWVLGVRLSWLGKRDLFRGPMGPLFRRLGGLPVDRDASQNLVRQAVDWFSTTPRLLLAIAPSGTRSRVAHWRSGFYHIARGAGVPILCTFLDYGRKVAGVGPPIVPTGDVRADMDRIRSFYAGIIGRYPALETPVRLREEA